MQQQVVDRIRRTPRLREGLRRVLTSLSIHKQGSKDDIIVFACRRSGSTWLMELLGAAPAMRFVNEPFIPGLVLKTGLPTGLENAFAPDLRKVVDVPADAEALYRNHLMNYRSTRVRGPYSLTSPQYHFVSDRRVIKVVHATGIADWITAQPLPLRPVFLARHPIATALSMARSNIQLRAPANLKHPGFRNRHLGDELASFAWEILESGSGVERFVLEWCLDNVVPYRDMQEHPERWSSITYEELMLNPEASLHRLGSELDINVTHRMTELARIPSASTSIQRRNSIATSDVPDWLGRWRDRTDEAFEERAFQIIDRFGIGLYERGRTVATEPFIFLDDTPRV